MWPVVFVLCRIRHSIAGKLVTLDGKIEIDGCRPCV